MISRRCACIGSLAGVFSSLAGQTAAQTSRARPICRFSARDGWSASEPASFALRRARSNDPSGLPQVIQRVKSSLSVDVPIDVYITQEEDNAFAMVSNGRRIVGADVDFLQRINSMAGTEWAAIQVLAHEVGHHIAGFDTNRHRGELNADYWSGQALQRLGAAREVSAASILAWGSDHDSPSHPNRRRRAETIHAGWDDASRNYIDYSFCLQCR